MAESAQSVNLMGEANGAFPLRIIYSRLRTEEKMLFQAADRLGIPYVAEDIRSKRWPDLGGYPGEVVICRCVSHTQNVALAQLLESKGVRTINNSSIMLLCGDKIATAARLDAARIPQPEYRVAFSPEGAVEAAEELGYPVVFKPSVGSWGRLLAKVNDRDAAEALVEHKSYLGPHHQVFFLQRYVEKNGYDLRVTVVGGKPVTAIKRCSSHWITNTARGAKAVKYPLEEDRELVSLLQRLYKVIPGDFLAVDLFWMDGRWVINEVNGQPEFRSSTISTTGVDLAAMMVQYAWSLVPEEALLVGQG